MYVIGVRGGAAPPPERVYIFGLPRKRVGACVTRTSGERSRTWLPRASVRQGARPGRPNPGAAQSCGFSRRRRVRSCACVVRIPRAGPRPGGGNRHFHPKSALLARKWCISMKIANLRWVSPKIGHFRKIIGFGAEGGSGAIPVPKMYGFP